MIFSKLR